MPLLLLCYYYVGLMENTTEVKNQRKPMIPVHQTIDETGHVTIEFESEFETLNET